MNKAEKGMLPSSARLTEFDTGNVVSFQIKVSGRNIKETTLARYFIKVTRQINTVH